MTLIEQVDPGDFYTPEGVGGQLLGQVGRAHQIYMVHHVIRALMHPLLLCACASTLNEAAMF